MHKERGCLGWLHSRVKGKLGALEFFKKIGAFQIHKFKVLSLMAGENQVAAEIVIDMTVPTGKRFQDEEIHLWTFNEETKIIRFRHYVDTAKHIEVAAQL